MKIIAHRGNGLVGKENTKKAILNSLNVDYVDGVEFDIRMTKDNKFVLCHEPFYNGKLISVTKYKNLKELDRLEDVLENIETNKIIMIEVKDKTNIRKIDYYLYKILKKYLLNFYVCSFNYKFMSSWHKNHPNITSGLIIGLSANDNKVQNTFDFNLLRYNYLDKLTPKETFIWTVNDVEIAKILPKTVNIITDKPKEIFDVVKCD